MIKTGPEVERPWSRKLEDGLQECNFFFKCFPLIFFFFLPHHFYLHQNLAIEFLLQQWMVF